MSNAQQQQPGERLTPPRKKAATLDRTFGRNPHKSIWAHWALGLKAQRNAQCAQQQQQQQPRKHLTPQKYCAETQHTSSGNELN